MFAVACVIRNRAENPGWWGGPDWGSVCLKPWQFSCWNKSSKNGGQAWLRDLSLSDIEAEYPKCLAAVKEARSGQPDITGGATHYVVTTWLDNPKLRPAWADQLMPTVTIGAHSFFTFLHSHGIGR